jgi:hypothetical protein
MSKLSRFVSRTRHAVGRALGNVLEQVLHDVKPRIITGGDVYDQYLSRYYIIGAPKMADGSSPYDLYGNPKRAAVFPDYGFGLYVHKFHRSDNDRALHSHPWLWALSFVIAGGYLEERRMVRRVINRTVAPLSINFISGNDFHRVDLLEKDAWTLFLVGPRAASWSFWNRDTGEETPWREFLAQKQREMS